MKKLEYFKSLDALRAFAAFGVVAAHYFSKSRMPGHGALHKIFELGNSGVSLFFVLSGFVITRILINTAQSPTYFQSFYMRRTLRIFPLYYFSLLLYYMYPWMIGTSDTILPITKEKSYFFYYFQNIARTFDWPMEGPLHFWSLAVEEHFYLFWPAVVYFTLKKGIKSLVAASIFFYVGSHLLRFYMSAKGYEINVFTFTRLDQLILGAFVAILELKGKLHAGNNKYFGVLLMVGAIGVAGLELFKMDVIKETFKHTFFGFLYMGMILLIVANGTSILLRKSLQNFVIQFLGKISYGIYVWHLLAIYLLDHYFKMGVFSGFIIVSSATIVMSTASFYLLEAPFLRLKSKFH